MQNTSLNPKPYIMKVRLFLLQCLITLICFHAYAQKRSLSKHWSFQLTSGTQFNYFTGQQPHRAISAGFNSQLRVNYALEKGWGLFAEGGYAGDGGNLVSFTDRTMFGFAPTIQFKNTKESVFLIHSGEAALGVSCVLPIKLDWKIRLYTAPLINVNFGEWENYQKTGALVAVATGDQTVISTINGHQYTNYFQPYWFSAMGGIQLELPIHRNAVLIDFRFVNGISTARFDYSYLNTPGIQGNIRTNSFRVAVGYLLHGFASRKASITSN